MATPSNTYTNPGTVAGGKPMYPTPMRPTRTPDAQSPTPQTPMSADPLFQNVYQRAQENLPQQPNNGNPRGANNMPGRGVLPPNNAYPLPRDGQPSAQRQAYFNQISGQQSDLGRYRPPTLAGDGNNPMNWNDAGGYAYNLPYAFGPRAQNGAGPYGGYPSYLLPNWRTTPGWG